MLRENGGANDEEPGQGVTSIQTRIPGFKVEAWQLLSLGDSSP